MTLKDLLSRLKGVEEVGEKQCKVCSFGGPAAADSLKAAYYKRVIERYAEVISFGEEKSIPELKKLVVPDECVRKKAAEFPVEGVAEAALDFVQKMPLMHSQLSVSFWLSPSEALELGAGDAMDKAVLLCSLLVAGGIKARVRVLEFEGGFKHAVVLCEKDGSFDLLDSCGSAPAMRGKSFDELLAAYSFQGKRVLKSLYEFGPEDYESFQ